MGQLKVFIHPLKIVETCIRRCVHRIERFPETFIKFGRWGAGLKMWPAQEQSFRLSQQIPYRAGNCCKQARLSQLLNDSFGLYN